MSESDHKIHVEYQRVHHRPIALRENIVGQTIADLLLTAKKLEISSAICDLMQQALDNNFKIVPLRITVNKPEDEETKLERVEIDSDVFELLNTILNVLEPIGINLNDLTLPGYHFVLPEGAEDGSYASVNSHLIPTDPVEREKAEIYVRYSTYKSSTTFPSILHELIHIISGRKAMQLTRENSDTERTPIVLSILGVSIKIHKEGEPLDIMNWLNELITEDLTLMTYRIVLGDVPRDNALETLIESLSEKLYISRNMAKILLRSYFDGTPFEFIQELYREDPYKALAIFTASSSYSYITKLTDIYNKLYQTENRN